VKASRLAIVSLALNIVLLAVVCWQTRHLTHPPDPRVLQDPAPSPLNSAPPPQPTAEPSAPPAQASSASIRPAFDWHQVESTDYRTYIKNLRATGCPEQTVRDIVAADVTSTFAARRAEALAARYQDFKYWETGPADAAARSELDRQRRAVDSDMGAVLRELLGPDVTSPETTREWKLGELNQQLGFLPADKRDAAGALLLRNTENDTLIKSLANARRPTEDADELNRILKAFADKRTDLETLLTPEEYERLDMTVSWTADNLRRAMVKFQPSEEEFREIFRAWRAHDEHLAQLYGTRQPDPGNAHVFARIREALGEQRYEEYRSTWWKK
jgi:hypothetical protein